MKKTYTSPEIDITVVSAQESIMLASSPILNSADITKVSSTDINFWHNKKREAAFYMRSLF